MALTDTPTVLRPAAILTTSYVASDAAQIANSCGIRAPTAVTEHVHLLASIACIAPY